MDRLDENYTVSTSHVRLRTVLFAAALVLAIGAFAFGVSRIAHKDAGYYEIETARTDEAPNYAGGFHLIYYLDGSSEQIRVTQNALKDLYQSALLRSYELLDSQKEYPGLVNLATLNENPGVPMTVSEELARVLRDAAEKSREHRGFQLFAGALYNEWNSILSLDDISEFDPAENPDTSQRIAELAAQTSRPDVFTMTFDGNTVCWDCTPEYRTFLTEGEYSGSILDLNLLKDAYRLAMVRDVLVENGYRNGYLSADSGLILYLPDHQGGKFMMYTPKEDGLMVCATVGASENSAFSFLHSYPVVQNELMYHATPKGYYHPCFAVETGRFENSLASQMTVRRDGDIVACAYQNMMGFSAADTNELRSAGQEMLYAYTFLEEPQVIYANRPGELKVESGCTVAK